MGGMGGTLAQIETLRARKSPENPEKNFMITFCSGQTRSAHSVRSATSGHNINSSSESSTDSNSHLDSMRIRGRQGFSAGFSVGVSPWERSPSEGSYGKSRKSIYLLCGEEASRRPTSTRTSLMLQPRLRRGTLDEFAGGECILIGEYEWNSPRCLREFDSDSETVSRARSQIVRTLCQQSIPDGIFHRDLPAGSSRRTFHKGGSPSGYSQGISAGAHRSSFSKGLPEGASRRGSSEGNRRRKISERSDLLNPIPESSRSRLWR